MQATKSRPGSLDVPQKPSPGHTARKLKGTGSDSDPFRSPKNKTPKDKSPKVVDRRSPRSPAIEKKKMSRLSELEPQLSQLQAELQKAKDELSSTESSKRRAQQEAEEAKKQLLVISANLEETQSQLKELSESEESRVHELRKISQDRDRVWQSELEAVQKQHSLDSAALASALNEIQRLKIQIERVSESEAFQARHAESAHGEIRSLRDELHETLELVEKLKIQLNESRESEGQALEEVGKAQMLLEAVKNTEETLRLEHANALKLYELLVVELEESKKKANLLEELVGNLQADLANSNKICEDESEMIKPEIDNLKNEANQLREALEEAEKRYHEQYLESTMQIREAYELANHAKSASCLKEAELEAKLRESLQEVDALKSKMMEKEGLDLNMDENEVRKSESVLEALNTSSLENESKLQESGQELDGLQTNMIEKEMLDLNSEENELKKSEAILEVRVPETEEDNEVHKSESVLEALRTSLLEKETKLQLIKEENEKLKSEITQRELHRNNNEAIETARSGEREALMKLGYLTEEADKSSRKAERVSEELDAAQTANSEMEAELRRLKVQADQWRKAAEAAAAMLSTGNNGKYVERTGSLDYHTIGGKLSLPYAEDTDDESPKKKNGNVLKKIGVLLKKGQK